MYTRTHKYIYGRHFFFPHARPTCNRKIVNKTLAIHVQHRGTVKRTKKYALRPRRKGRGLRSLLPFSVSWLILQGERTQPHARLNSNNFSRNYSLVCSSTTSPDISSISLFTADNTASNNKSPFEDRYSGERTRYKVTHTVTHAHSPV